jgi:transcriptional regulator with XRE-family HTH domain
VPKTLDWPLLVSSYRINAGLTQQDLAYKFGVTASTVSRWESGKQIPDLKAQSLINNKVNSINLQTKEEWIFRVNTSFGHEILFDSKDVILAVSDVLVRFHKIDREHIAGTTLTMFFRSVFATEASVVHATTRDVMNSAFFSGGIRSIRQISDVRVPGGVVRFSSDFWPIVTCEDEILALIVANRLGPSPEPELCRSYRLVSSTPTMRAQFPQPE